MRWKRLLLLLTLLPLLLAACSGRTEPAAPEPSQSDGAAEETAVRPQFVEFYADW